MEPQLFSISHSDPLWLAVAFVAGLVARTVGLPPMVGFLLAGFLLNLLGVQGGDFLEAVANLGITLLLFSIGLKLKLKSLARPEVWGVAGLHMAGVSVLIAGLILLLSVAGIPLISEVSLPQALLIGFALSFSSTVFAVKILDELGAASARHGNIALGVLVVQDIAAVVFLAVSAGKLPSVWAVSLVLMIPLRFLLFRILERVGHGELLILFGITLALVGANLFELLGIKGDVGALLCGMLLASHRNADELAKSLLGFKELFLVGFFLSVGMTALPGWTEMGIALLLILFLPVKVAMYYGLFNLFYLRASTAWRTALNLANYSEFGLIVGALAASADWLPKEWLAVFALLLSVSFIVSAPLVNIRDRLYQAWKYRLEYFERPRRLAGEEDLELAHFKVVVFGMGRMGTSAYTAMEPDYRGQIVGVDMDTDKVALHCKAGRQVVCGNATNPDFWTRSPDLIDGLEWVLLTLSSHKANTLAAGQLRQAGYRGHIAAVVEFPDQAGELVAAGVDHTFDIYAEAGLGFANELRTFLQDPVKAPGTVAGN